MIFIIAIAMMISVVICIIMGGADIGKDIEKDNIEIGKWIDEKHNK